MNECEKECEKGRGNVLPQNIRVLFGVLWVVSGKSFFTPVRVCSQTGDKVCRWDMHVRLKVGGDVQFVQVLLDARGAVCGQRRDDVKPKGSSSLVGDGGKLTRKVASLEKPAAGRILVRKSAMFNLVGTHRQRMHGVTSCSPE